MPSRFWYLLSRKLADEATLDEIRELEKIMLENPDSASIAEIYSDFFRKKQVRKISPEELVEAWVYQMGRMEGTFDSVFKKRQKNNQSINLRNKRSFLIAALFLFIVIAIGWMMVVNKERKGGIPNVSDSEIITVNADKEVKKILPDGSQVWLNKGSKVLYNSQFGETNRDITLEGEAFFDVVHKAELPMVVHAGTIEIRVKGTAFNVKAYAGDDKVEAALIRGSIEVLNVGNKKERFLMKPNEKLVVAVNRARAKSILMATDIRIPERFQLDTLRIEETSGLIPEISWIQGKLVFNNETFSQLADKLGRWYNVQFTFANIELTNEKFTGVFESESLQEALSALQFTYDFNYSIEGNKVIIKKK